MPDWITSPEAANRLGIKQATLYAYVSRGMLARRREAVNRASLFDAAEVDRLARRRRSGRGTASGRFLMETGVTQISIVRMGLIPDNVFRAMACRSSIGREVSSTIVPAYSAPTLSIGRLSEAARCSMGTKIIGWCFIRTSV